MGEDFSKIQGRFATRIALSSADADEVIKKRILHKRPEVRPVLEKLYQEYESSIKNIVTFSEGTPRRRRWLLPSRKKVRWFRSTHFKRDVENLATLMISKVDEDKLELTKKVEKSLRTLCDEALIQRNGDGYTFLTNEEREAELRIQHYNIDPKDVVDYVAQVAFEEVIAFPNNKYRYSARYQFPFNQFIDDRAYRNTISHKIGLKLLTAYSGKEDEVALGLLSYQEKCVVVRMSDTYAYLSEIDGMKKIEAFLNDPTSAKLMDFEVISVNKRKERSQRAKRASEYIQFALENADIYVAGEKISVKQALDQFMGRRMAIRRKILNI